MKAVFGVLVAVLVGLALSATAQTKPEPREGGILGTGIVGTITKLGSIYVNGQHIRFAPNLAVSGGIGVETAEALRPGDTVAATVEPEGDAWRALRLERVLPIIGPVASLSGGGAVVMGTRVVLPADVGPVRVGDWVAVGGLWQGAAIIASAVSVIPPQAQARMQGSFFFSADGAAIDIGGSLITGILPQNAQEGAVVRVTGQPMATGLAARMLGMGVFAQTPGLVLAEGYMSAPRPSGLYTLLGSGLVEYAGDPAMVADPARVQRCGVGDRLVSGDGVDGALAAGLARLGCMP
ncbi:hypothetical protein SAMN05216227_101570 [Pseudorhodobacter antarcticus]|uniref:DUF5666 domain-containing protein n=1 Tax=Pseudorhodobacter antarcticus TaxID=1077947 RepID=A0A1H8H0Q0_9RHOB|nr:hypothetical protein [Pseudorhodobacter antarcticus]SEN49544.1 hypothetical protein SAMN05216227_101570 [Pseudorhodobacter antarcticus]